MQLTYIEHAYLLNNHYLDSITIEPCYPDENMN